MRVTVTEDARQAGVAAAQELALALRESIRERGRGVLALSRLDSDSALLLELVQADLDWAQVHVLQVDERVVGPQDARRNALNLRAALIERGPLPPANWHAMPVEQQNREASAESYGDVLRQLSGPEPRIDAIHLGLGTDGHTASLLPDSPALGEKQRLVSWATSADGQLRMTLTYPALDRARRIVWLVTGAAKAPMLAQLIDGSTPLPATRVERAEAVVIVDAAAHGTS